MRRILALFLRRVRTRSAKASVLAVLLAVAWAAGPTCQAQCEASAAPVAAGSVCHESPESEGARDQGRTEPCGRGESPCVISAAGPVIASPHAAPLVALVPAATADGVFDSTGFVPDPRPFPSPPPIRLSAVLRL
jgi:hypothetical protein